MLLILAALPLLVPRAWCYYMPVLEESGSALETLIAFIRQHLIPSALDFFASPPEIKKSFWEIAKEYVGIEEPKVVEEPIICCNSFLILTILSLVFVYIIFVKKYFATVAAPRNEFIPFMAEEEDNEECNCFGFEPPPSVTKSCLRCNGDKISEKGDANEC